MKKYIFRFIVGALIIGSTFSTSSCKKHVGPTSLVIQDSIRHYYTILQGQKLEMTYRVANIGSEPLVFTDIHPSCGCIAVSEKGNNIVLPGKETTLKFIFDSSKNIGFVEHTIYLYGNIDTTGMATMMFDVHVVPPFDASPDYEAFYYESNKMESFAKGLTEGKENERGYWINDGDYPEDYSRTYKKYPWREKNINK